MHASPLGLDKLVRLMDIYLKEKNLNFILKN